MPYEFSDEEYDAIEHALREAKGWACKGTQEHNWICYALQVLNKDYDAPLPEAPSDDDGLYPSQREGKPSFYGEESD